MVATADLRVYNAENFCVSFFNQVAPIFHLREGKIKKKFFLGLPSVQSSNSTSVESTQKIVMRKCYRNSGNHMH